MLEFWSSARPIRSRDRHSWRLLTRRPSTLPRAAAENTLRSPSGSLRVSSAAQDEASNHEQGRSNTEATERTTGGSILER